MPLHRLLDSFPELDRESEKDRTECEETLLRSLQEELDAELEIQKHQEAARAASIETAELIRALSTRLEQEHNERIRSEQENARHQWINTVCVVISLVLALWPYLTRVIDLIHSAAG